MKKLRLVAVAAILGGFAIFASAPAQAYPDVAVTLTTNHIEMIGGKTLNFKAASTANNVECDWTVTYADGIAAGEDPERTGSGLSLSGSYKTKVVTKSTPTTIKAECLYDPAVAPVVAPVSSNNTVVPAIYSGKATTLQAARTASATPDSITVTLLPLGGGGGDNNGSLPDTGGSNLSWLVIGGALVLVGGGVTYAARRRQSAR